MSYFFLVIRYHFSVSKRLYTFFWDCEDEFQLFNKTVVFSIQLPVSLGNRACKREIRLEGYAKLKLSRYENSLYDSFK